MCVCIDHFFILQKCLVLNDLITNSSADHLIGERKLRAWKKGNQEHVLEDHVWFWGSLR